MAKLLRDPQGNQVYAFDETADAAEIAEKLAGQASTYPGREDEVVGAWEDVTPEAGGSAFAHLTEDTLVTADVGIYATPDGETFGSTYAGFETDGSIHLLASAPTDNILLSETAGESLFIITADGSLHWGDGAGAPAFALAPDFDAGGLVLNTDLYVGDPSGVVVDLTAGQVLVTAATTNSSVVDVGVNGGSEGFVVKGDGRWYGRELSGDPAAPSANQGVWYFKDIGGKTALVVRFPTGAVQQIAIEP